MPIIQSITQTITRVPDWIEGNSGLKKLAAIGTGGAATLIAFAEDPQGFIVGTILEVFVGFILSGFAILNTQLEMALAPLAALPATIGRPLVGAGETVVTPILGVVGTLDSTIQAVVASAGPLAPIVVVLITAVGIVVVLFLVRLLVYDILPLVIPWL